MNLYWLLPLLGCLSVAVVFVGGGFLLGVWWSRLAWPYQQSRRVVVRHPSSVRSHVREIREEVGRG